MAGPPPSSRPLPSACPSCRASHPGSPRPSAVRGRVSGLFIARDARVGSIHRCARVRGGVRFPSTWLRRRQLARGPRRRLRWAARGVSDRAGEVSPRDLPPHGTWAAADAPTRDQRGFHWHGLQDCLCRAARCGMACIRHDRESICAISGRACELRSASGVGHAGARPQMRVHSRDLPSQRSDSEALHQKPTLTNNPDWKPLLVRAGAGEPADHECGHETWNTSHAEPSHRCGSFRVNGIDGGRQQQDIAFLWKEGKQSSVSSAKNERSIRSGPSAFSNRIGTKRPGAKRMAGDRIQPLIPSHPCAGDR
jgi:hypothetical protein